MVQATIANAYPKIPEQGGEKNLRHALNNLDAGKISAEELEEVCRATIVRAINHQGEAGLDIVTDGQIRWDDPFARFTLGVDGLTRGGLLRYFDNNTYYRRPVVSGELQFRKSVLVDDFKFAQALSPKPVKVILPGPDTFFHTADDQYYFDQERLTAALTNILREELKALQKAKCKIVQFEEPWLLFRPDRCEDAARWFNMLISDIEMEFWLCFYFGSFTAVADRMHLFKADVVAVDVSSHPHDLETFLNLETDKRKCFGIFDARNIRLEDEDETLSRLRKIARHERNDNFIISTSASLEYLPPIEAHQKVMLLGKLKDRFNQEG